MARRKKKKVVEVTFKVKPITLEVKNSPYEKKLKKKYPPVKFDNKKSKKRK